MNQSTVASQELCFRSDKGLAYLCDGDYDSAIREFRQAVRVVSLTIKPDQEAAPEFSNLFVNSLEIADFLEDANTDMEDVRNICGDFSDHNTLYLHTGAFRLFQGPTPHVSFSSNNHMKNSSIAAALLYNIGLAFHLKARQTSDHQSVSFQKATSAYEMAIQALRRDDDTRPHDIPRSVCDTNLFLALFTNKAHASYHFLDWNTSQHCVRVVQQLLAEAPPAPQEQQVAAQYYQDFHMNVVFAEGHCSRSAPAA